MVSVIVPSHNSALYIAETLKSILDQDYEDIEIIVADDCSNDNTVEVVRSLNSGRIRCIRNNECHGGPSLPRNLGIKGSRGEYIAFCDSDDLFTKHKLSESVRCLEVHQDIGMCFTNAIKFNENDEVEKDSFLSAYSQFRVMPKKKGDNRIFLIGKEDAYKGLFFENFILSPGCVVLPRHVLSMVGYFDESLKNADDWDMWLRITEKFAIGFIDIIGLKYRKRTGSISARGVKLIENRVRVLRRHLNKQMADDTRNQIRQLIAENYLGGAYAYQSDGDMGLAREYYLKSMKSKYMFSSIKGLAVTLLGTRFYKAIRPYYNKLKKA